MAPESPGIVPSSIGPVLLVSIGLILAACGQPDVSVDRPNVLFIAMDDMRPLLGCYGDQTIRTPHIDGLAARGATFTRAYCQVPQCSPSRVSIMTGLRPETTEHYSNRHPFHREDYPDLITVSQHFKNHGYHSQSYGKIYHDGADDPASWSVPSSPGRDREMWEVADEEAIAQLPFAQRASVPTIIPPRLDCPAIQAPDVPDEALYAGRMTGQAIKTIAQLRDRPFFLAIGYRRPHLPLVAPKKYSDWYPTDEMALPEHRQPPRDVPLWSIYNSVTYWSAKQIWGIEFPKYPSSLEEALRFAGFELRSYQGIPMDGPIPDPLQKKVWQAYMASVSYVDAQIGRLLEALNENGLTERTIVVLWSDHGWHLGEHGTWAKMTLFEWATRVPLIIVAPGRSQSVRTAALVELVDVYPTLAELADLPIPEHVEGTSMVPLFEDPDRPWKKAAFSQFPRHDHSMGHSLRTDRYRYTQWEGLDGTILAQELYDHQADPRELINLADSPEAASRVTTLSQQLKAGWRSAQPDP